MSDFSQPVNMRAVDNSSQCRDLSWFNAWATINPMSHTEPERTRSKRPPGRPKQPETMTQISIRMPVWMIKALDALNEHERYGQGDRASLIREAVAAYLEVQPEGQR